MSQDGWLNFTKRHWCFVFIQAWAFACQPELLKGRLSASATDAQGYLARLHKTRRAHDIMSVFNELGWERVGSSKLNVREQQARTDMFVLKMLSLAVFSKTLGGTQTKHSVKKQEVQEHYFEGAEFSDWEQNEGAPVHQFYIKLACMGVWLERSHYLRKNIKKHIGSLPESMRVTQLRCGTRFCG